MRTRTALIRIAALGLLAAGASACGNKPAPVADKEPIPAASAPGAGVSAVVSIEAGPPAAAVPTLVAEAWSPQGIGDLEIFPVEGALLVAEGQRVGRIAGDTVEWIGKIPK